MSKKYLSLATALMATFSSGAAFAQGDSGASSAGGSGVLALGAGIAIGLAVLGGGLGQGRTAAAALEGISRNPGAAARIQTPMIIGLALIESLVLLAFVIAFLITGKL